eukprot:gene24004-29051_t
MSTTHQSPHIAPHSQSHCTANLSSHLTADLFAQLQSVSSPNAFSHEPYAICKAT